MNHIATEINYNPAEDILVRYQVLKKQNPEIRARNAAEELGISEGELLAAKVGNGEEETAIRLIDNPQEILKEVKTLGEVMALTRNEYCVSERKGIYENDSFFEHGKMKQGLFVNPDIDLRLFMNHWQYCFAAFDQTKTGIRKSLQFFDKSGVAIHKIYLTNKSNENAFDELVKKFTHTKQESFIDILESDKKPADLPDSEIDWEGFRQSWENLKDTHDFFPMLRKFKVGREQALKHIGSDFAYRVENNSSREILNLAAKEGLEIMVFVGNKGCIQIHTGPVKKLAEYGSWYNVLDPKFNLHLNEDKIASTWVVKKPTIDGIVTALEVFDNEGELIVTFFGKRKPGIAELELWREVVAKIPAKNNNNDFVVNSKMKVADVA